jgi:hypothetical protein
MWLQLLLSLTTSVLVVTKGSIFVLTTFLVTVQGIPVLPQCLVSAIVIFVHCYFQKGIHIARLYFPLIFGILLDWFLSSLTDCSHYGK